MVVKEEYCSAARKPKIIRSCSEVTPCEHKWYASEWSEVCTQSLCYLHAIMSILFNIVYNHYFILLGPQFCETLGIEYYRAIF